MLVRFLFCGPLMTVASDHIDFTGSLPRSPIGVGVQRRGGTESDQAIFIGGVTTPLRHRSRYPSHTNPGLAYESN